MNYFQTKPRKNKKDQHQQSVWGNGGSSHAGSSVEAAKPPVVMYKFFEIVVNLSGIY